MTPRQIFGVIIMIAGIIGGIVALVSVKTIMGVRFIGANLASGIHITEGNYVLVWIVVAIAILAGTLMIFMPQAKAPQSGEPK